MSGEIRLFVGLALTDAARDSAACIAQPLRERVSAAFYDPELYHITLAFLGMVPRERLGVLQNTLSSVRFAPFSVKIGGVSTFEKGILYARVAPNEPLYALQKQICDVLRKDGWQFDDRPYVPHITLARKFRAELPQICTQYTDMPVSGFSLFESARVDGILRYTPIMRWEAVK